MGREVIEISYKIAPSLLNQQEEREREREREEKRKDKKMKFQWNTIGYARHDIMLT